MFFGILTLIVGLAISGVAAWYSIVGLMAIFAAAKIPIAIMGAVLEVGKLLTASWLYQFWDKTNTLLKSSNFVNLKLIYPSQISVIVCSLFVIVVVRPISLN